MQGPRLLAGVVFVVGTVHVCPALAQSPAQDTLRLTLSQARVLALRQSLELLIAREDVAVAQGEFRQARLLPNPQLAFETPRAAGVGVTSAYEASIAQEIEWAGQRGLRARAAQAGVQRADFSGHDAARRVVGDATRGFYGAVAAQQRLAVAQVVLTLNDTLLRAVRIQAREGEISRVAASLAEIEYGRARARVLAAQREVTTAEIALKQTLALPPTQVIRLDTTRLGALPPGARLALDSLVQVALAQRPDLAADAQRQQQVSTLQRLARREAIPNLWIGPRLEREPETGTTRLGLVVGLPLPLWNRNQGLRDQRRAEADQALLERRRTELRVRTEVAEAHQAFVAASEEADVYETQVLRPARQSQRALEVAFRAGKIDLPSLLLTRNQLLDAELGYWDAWLAQREAWVRLQAATASVPLENPDPNDER